MRRLAALVLVSFVACAAPAARAADDAGVKAGARQVESGVEKMREGKVGEGAEDAAKGVGKTVAESARFAGEKLKESGEAARPEAKNAWEQFRDGSFAFGRSVRDFFSRLFSAD